MATKAAPVLPHDGVILHNLRAAAYKLTSHPLDGRVTSVTSHGDHVFVARANKGCQVYRYVGGAPFAVCELGQQMAPRAGDAAAGSTMYDLSASDRYLVYLKEQNGTCSVCVHDMKNVLNGILEPLRSLSVNRQAPLVVIHQLKYIIMACSAWSVSWTSDQEEPDCTDEKHVRVMSLVDFETVREWKVADNGISLLRTQVTPEHSMLGVADTRTGLKVFDLNQPRKADYTCVYQVPVEEIRNFELVGNFVAVFHKFEPNVSFWNMKEQRTILCINIQDQMRELLDEFTEDDLDEDVGLFGDDDDHVTAVTSVQTDNNDDVLIYGTKSGCVFGMSVQHRIKLFNIPCAHEVPEAEAQSAALLRRDVRGIKYLSGGKLVICYEKYGLTLLDFSLDNPPDRPPTRCQKRPVTG